jgi:lipopolysaccharide transport system ATP-binding protein
LDFFGFRKPEKGLPMSSDVTIKVIGVSKSYQIYDKPSDRLKQFLLPRLNTFLGRKTEQHFREFWALKDISFEVKRGETVGIIGQNGSGKSTLLQMICGTLNTTSGEIYTHGRIAALLELGSGFNPEFTGRENVYMNAALLGLSKCEIDDKFDEIAAFADIGDFIEQPVKTYSSGMIVRLAFAVQAQVKPDILIVDEALAVGDAKFQAKCFNRLKQLKQNGTSILLVTHSSEQIVTHCDFAVLLDHGREIVKGEPKYVVNRYLDLLFGKKSIESKPIFGAKNQGFLQEEGAAKKADPKLQLSLNEDKFLSRVGYNPHEYRWGDGAAKILDFHLTADDEEYPSSLVVGQKIQLTCAIKFIRKIVRPILGVTIKTKDGVTVYGINSESTDLTAIKDTGEAGQIIIVSTNFICALGPGDYFISLGLASSKGSEIIPHDRRYDSIHLQVKPTEKFFGLINLGLSLEVKEVI